MNSVTPGLNRCNTKAFHENPLICAVQIIYMKSRSLLLSGILILLLGCSKDQNQASPTIGLKSYTDHVPPNSAFNASFNYSQTSGNLSGDTLWIFRHRLNTNTSIPIGEETPDTIFTQLPATPNASKAEFNVSLAWANISYGIGGDNDTFNFKFVLVDLMGHHSDTVTTGNVVVLQ